MKAVVGRIGRIRMRAIPFHSAARIRTAEKKLSRGIPTPFLIDSQHLHCNGRTKLHTCQEQGVGGVTWPRR